MKKFLEKVMKSKKINTVLYPYSCKWNISVGIKKDFMEQYGVPSDDGPFAYDPDRDHFPWRARTLKVGTFDSPITSFSDEDEEDSVEDSNEYTEEEIENKKMENEKKSKAENESSKIENKNRKVDNQSMEGKNENKKVKEIGSPERFQPANTSIHDKPIVLLRRLEEQDVTYISRKLTGETEAESVEPKDPIISPFSTICLFDKLLVLQLYSIDYPMDEYAKECFK